MHTDTKSTPPAAPETSQRFTVKSTGYGSARFGICSVCRKEAPDVHRVRDATGPHSGILYGHRECLVDAVGRGLRYMQAVDTLHTVEHHASTCEETLFAYPAALRLVRGAA